MSRHDITITITGGDRFERETLASEIVALLESVHILLSVAESIDQPGDEEHEDHLQYIAEKAIVHIIRRES